MKESELERKLTEFCKKEGILTYKFVSVNNKGVPDRIYMFAGKVLFVELKVGNNKPTLLQQSNLKKIMKQGVPAYWVNTLEDGKELLLRLRHGKRFHTDGASISDDRRFTKQP